MKAASVAASLNSPSYMTRGIAVGSGVNVITFERSDVEANVGAEVKVTVTSEVTVTCGAQDETSNAIQMLTIKKCFISHTPIIFISLSHYPIIPQPHQLIPAL
jgi:hypothetical protein